MCGVRDSALLAKKHAHELKMSVYRFFANYGTLTWLFAPHCVPAFSRLIAIQGGNFMDHIEDLQYVTEACDFGTAMRWFDPGRIACNHLHVSVVPVAFQLFC